MLTTCFVATAPTAVQSLSLAYNGSHFLVTWEEPAEPNGVLNYTVTFMSQSLASAMQELVLLEMEVVTELMFSPSVTGLPYTLYVATVMPSTGGGAGPETVANFTTPQGSKFSMKVANWIILVDQSKSNAGSASSETRHPMKSLT